MTGSVAAAVWYAYAVVGPVNASVRTAAGDLEVIGDDEVAVVAGPVALAEFGTEILTERLNDERWLEEKARLHEEVVRRLLGVTAVVPLRFGSIHHDRAGVEAFVDGRRGALLAALDRVRGRVEVGVKVWIDRRTEARGGTDESAASGREYLERRRRARDTATTARAERSAVLAQVHERLLAVSDEGIVNRPQPRELTGRTNEEMLLNAAYLVRAGDDAVPREVERLRSESPDFVFEVTGPWAAYNFVDLGAAG